MLVEGTDNYQYESSYCYFTVFDDVNIPVSASTTLSYWLLPVNGFGRYIGVELEFTDGSVLRSDGAVDYNGINMHPHSGRGVVGQWNFITSNIGQWCEGKVIKRILVAYDQQTTSGQFKGYIDDIIIKN